MAFTPEEETVVQSQLALLVRALRHVPGGGKIEEDYWSYVYHIARGASVRGWSNMPMRDFTHNGLGVEMKLLKSRKSRRPFSHQGKRIMHPAATRAIAFNPADSAEDCKVAILTQFGSQIAAFRERVKEDGGVPQADIRWGVLLWNVELTEFLYFEERMIEPNPNDYRAEFVVSNHRGSATRNLHIFEKATDIKRFSVTRPEKGAKVQPYYDVPYIGEGAYAFTVPDDDRKPLWVKGETFQAIEEVAAEAGLDVDEYLKIQLGL